MALNVLMHYGQAFLNWFHMQIVHYKKLELLTYLPFRPRWYEVTSSVIVLLKALYLIFLICLSGSRQNYFCIILILYILFVKIVNLFYKAF